MYAVIQTGGKQYCVSKGDVLKIEKLAAVDGDKIEFDKILLAGNGGDIKVGAPFLDGGKVVASIVAQGRGKKVHIVKMRRRKNSRRRTGHRQSYTEIRIEDINA